MFALSAVSVLALAATFVQATPCALESSVDISKGERAPNGAITSDGISYEPGTYFTYKGSIRGCPCEIGRCLPKCCQSDHAMVNGTCQPYGGDVSAILRNYTVSMNFSSSFQFVHSNDLCKTSELYRLSPLDYEDEVFYIQDDGELFMPSAAQTRDTFDQKEYCMELFVQNETGTEVSAIICIDEPHFYVSYGELDVVKTNPQVFMKSDVDEIVQVRCWNG